MTTKHLLFAAVVATSMLMSAGCSNVWEDEAGAALKDRKDQINEVVEALKTTPPVEESMKVKDGTIEYEDGIMIGLDGTMEAKPVNVPVPPDKITAAIRGYLKDIAFEGVNAKGVPGGIIYDEFFGNKQYVGPWDLLIPDLDHKLRRVNQILELSKDKEVNTYFTEVKTLLEQAKANRDYAKYVEAQKKLYDLAITIWP